MDSMEKAASSVLHRSPAELLLCPSARVISKPNGGHDSYFHSTTAMGVYDGVSGVARVPGCDPKAFSSRLAMECNKAEKHITEAGYQSKTHKRAATVLSEGISGLRSSGLRGSTTAVLCTVHGTNLDVACIGDSRVSVYRRQGEKGNFVEIYRSRTTHFRPHDTFNCPAQVSRVPLEVPGRYHTHWSRDAPFAPATPESLRELMSEETVRIRVGDMVVMGSDGLWDNLFQHQVARIINSTHTATTRGTRSNSSSPVAVSEAVSDALVKAAYQCSILRDILSPFTLEARAHARREVAKMGLSAPLGLRQDASMLGGKPDDITCVAAVCVGERPAIDMAVRCREGEIAPPAQLGPREIANMLPDLVYLSNMSVITHTTHPPHRQSVYDVSHLFCVC
ncbi:unnamed protein product [Vitrella brassicaformis CCMP3155]|uniref:Protein phosphatase n=1 Tax=Vitrella brassicaformis (strain CCMP3155) TaxID=1169540 RepID=A0A0G4GH20_VITBC|nr:unnamed protein product [Vitrella brassicaformis CCMP3155]|eukprot:CEM28899.1 unnamed protein product [Vitrella brassicaformis CCMP3155]